MRGQYSATISCMVCGEQRRVCPGSKRKYCSRACAAIGQQTMVLRLCPICGTGRLFKPSQIKRGRGVYCSHACFTLGVTRHGDSSGGSISAEYETWSGMKNRCISPNDISYPNYGGRGIAVCDRWRDSFESFLADMGRRPSPNHSIDRIDNTGNYEPGNVRWATRTEQQRNLRSNRLLTFNGETRCMADWAGETGLSPQVISYRLKIGWSIERTLTTPVDPRKSNR